MSALTTLRAIAVAVAATAGAASVVALAIAAAPAPREAAGAFPDLLVALAAVALAGCAGWAWLSVVAVLVEAATGRVGRVRGVPAVLRRAVLVLCGLTVLAALASPATAVEPRPDDGATIAGLPYPDRAAGADAPAPPAPPAPVPPARTHTVVTGDSLWSIARARRPAASDAVLARDVARLYALNRAAIGADPDLIRPGQRLTTPPATR